MNEMIERVAQAISLSFREEGYDPTYDDPAVWEEFRRAAREAIVAMREPTEAMMRAAGIHYDMIAWRAMIDAALKE